MPELVARILAALPQTQCTRCGYPDCAAYAQAIATGRVPINQCPPGGAEGIRRLAALTGQRVTPLNPANGLEGPSTLCIKACPTDAILGTNKLMHTVIESYCTGCELCVPACPVDCISLENVTGEATAWAAWPQALADQARDRYEFSSYRRNRDEGENDKRLEAKAKMKLADLASHSQHTNPGQKAGSD